MLPNFSLVDFLYLCGKITKKPMDTIQIKDKTFAISIPESVILKQVQRVANAIEHDYAGQNPLFLVVLNGAFVFAADLIRAVRLSSEVTFVKLSSYEGMSSTGVIKSMIGLNTDLTGRPVIIVEDIIDSGQTMVHLLDEIAAQNPASVAVCTLLVKPENLKVKLDVKYCCMEIPNDFIVGYGLDYDGYGRNLRDIYTVVE